MNATSAFRADAGSSGKSGKVLVWDLPVRIFHWLMVLSFAGAWLTAESERWRLLHVTLGYTMVGLVVFRIFWGLIGTRYARFTSFVPGPGSVKRYVSSIFRGRPEHHVGHNPIGALGIVAMLLLTLIVGISGWATYNDMAGDWLEEVHEVAAVLFLCLVGVHLGGVIVSSLLHRENLVGAMVSGFKSAAPREGIRTAWRTVGVVMIAVVAGFWWMQWQDAPVAGGASPAVATASHAGKLAHDHD